MSTLDVHTIASSSDEVDQFKSVASLHALSHEHLLHIAFESSQEQENEDGGDKNKKQIRKKKKKSVTEITGGLNRRPGYAETLGQEVRAKRAIFDAKDITVDLSFTIAVVGSDNVGKRSLIRRICKEESFEIKSNHVNQPKKIFFKNALYSVDGIVVDVQFWIAPGHEEFKRQTGRYLTNVAGVMSVFDVTNQESLEVASAWVKELDDQRLIGSRNGYGQFKKKNRFDTAKFSDTLKTDERRPPGFLIGNRIDVKQPPRVITYSQGSDVAYTLEYDYYETSAISAPKSKSSSSTDDDDIIGGPTPITMTSDELKEKIDEIGDPELVVMSMVREILRFLPKPPAVEIPRGSNLSKLQLALLTCSPDLLVSLNLQIHRPLYTSIPESIFQSYQNKDIALTITRASDDADAKLASIFGNNIPPGLKDGFLVSGEDGQFLLPAKDKEAGYADLDGTSQTGSNFNGGPGSNNAARNPMLSLVGKTPFIAIAPRNAILNARLKYKTALEQSQCRQRDIVATSYLDWL